MIERIIALSGKNRLITLLLVALLMGWGYWALTHSPLDALA